PLPFRNPGLEALGTGSPRQVSDLAVRQSALVSVDLLLPYSGVFVPMGRQVPMGRRAARVKPSVCRPGLPQLWHRLPLATLLLYLSQRSVQGLGGVGPAVGICHYSDFYSLARQAILLMDLRMRRAGRDLGGSMASPRSQRTHK